MIVVLSTSSPLASAAAFSADHRLLASESMEAPMAASGACLAMLDLLFDRTNKAISDVEVFVADIGPGSFTGVKVAVTLAKALAYSLERQTGGISSFDLISADKVVALLSRKGEWFVRRPGLPVERASLLPNEEIVGFGPGISDSHYPDAANAGPLLSLVTAVSPEELVPNYVVEPSISTPKKPFIGAGAAPA